MNEPFSLTNPLFCANAKRLLDSHRTQSITTQICDPLKRLFNMFRSSESSRDVENFHPLQTRFPQQKGAGVVSWKSTRLSLIYTAWLVRLYAADSDALGCKSQLFSRVLRVHKPGAVI